METLDREEQITQGPQEKSRPSTSQILKELRSRTDTDESAEMHSTSSSKEYTIEDYIDTMEQVQNARRYLAKSFEIYMEKSTSQDGLDTSGLDRATIIKQRPRWEEHFPQDDSDEEKAKWDEFVLSFEDPGLQNSLRYLEEQSTKLDEIKNNPPLKDEIEQFSTEKQEIMAHAAAYRHLEREEEAILLQIEKLQADAILKGETEYPNKHHLESLFRRIEVTREARESIILNEGVIEELARREALDSKRQFESGILMTEQMKEVERKQLSSLLRGEPVLLVGETGGAKTALARELAKKILARTGKANETPEIVSGFGEINTYQLMGKSELEPFYALDEHGNKTITTVSEFMSGPLVRAMQEGRPVILDEVNAMPSEIIKRLNIIMQLRPGDKYTVQENNGMELTVQPGFCIIATMNEKSHRYRGVEELSSEFKDRFGVNIGRIHYPDQDVPPGGEAIPEDLLRLAMAVCTDKNGEVKLRNMSSEELLKLVRVAHFTQMLYTLPANDARLGSIPDESRVAESGNGTTALSKVAISPRTMVQIIEKVEQGRGNITLQEALSDFTDRIEDPIDKDTIIKLLEDYSLSLPDRNS